jgi:phosphoenolpyruvate synthase/pyruvate phosphate dikinase
MFTKSPFADQPNRGYLELAVGLGEILCSAQGEGTPLRIEFDRETGEATVLSFPSYPDALMLNTAGVLEWQPVEYGAVPLITDGQVRSSLVGRLAVLARRIETEMGCPQDVEGAILGDVIYVVQSRPSERG